LFLNKILENWREIEKNLLKNFFGKFSKVKIVQKNREKKENLAWINCHLKNKTPNH